VQLFLVRLARANVFGLRAFACVRWEKQLQHNAAGVCVVLVANPN
jgi:hypothetical protein